MPATASLWHLLNFCAPAAFLAMLLVLARWLFARKATPILPWYGQLALHFLLGCAACLSPCCGRAETEVLWDMRFW